jgi:hypothetical protein
MLFDFPFIADWKKTGELRQQLTDLDTAHENKGRLGYDYKVGSKILVRNDDILCNVYYCKPPVLDLFVEKSCFDRKGFKMISHTDVHFNPSSGWWDGFTRLHF